jgi:hypothetical protein
MIQSQNLGLFAGIPVKDYAASLKWYEQLLGSPPSFIPDDSEAVWELAENRYIYIIHQPERAGYALNTVFLDSFDTVMEQISERGIEPLKRESYSNGVRKTTYRDPDGNEIGFGGAPL